MKRFISLLLTFLATSAPAQLTPPQVKALFGCLKSSFSISRWTASFSADLGFIYYDSPEARKLEIEALEQQAKADPEDSDTRVRLGLLLRPTSPSEANRWQKEAETLYRQRLAADPTDTLTLAALADLLKGTAEAETLALQAIQQAPDAWQSWDAQASHQLQKLRLKLMEGLKDLPESGFDKTRLDEGLSLQARFPERTKTALILAGKVLADGRKAVELAPPGESWPVQRHYGRVTEIYVYEEKLRERLGSPPSESNEYRRQLLDLLAKAVPACGDQPEALGVLIKLQFDALYPLLPKTVSGKPDPAILEKRQTEVLGPTLTRLRELCDHPDPALAAAACEAYAVSVHFLPHSGGHPPADNSELPALLAKAVRLDPRRAWAWDLRLSMATSPSKGLPAPDLKTARALALERLQHLPTGRSHALVALTIQGQDALDSWIQALTLEPDNVEYLLNSALAILSYLYTPDARATALVGLQKATTLWHENPTLQTDFPQLDAFRLRIFAIHQALSDNLENALQTLVTLLEQYPDDAEARAMQQILRPTP